MLKREFGCALISSLLMLVSPAPAATDDAIDLRPYLPIEPYDGKAYRFLTLAKSGETSYWQTYKVAKEKGELFLYFNEYDQDFSLLAENRQRVAADGLRSVSRTVYFKGKGGILLKILGLFVRAVRRAQVARRAHPARARRALPGARSGQGTAGAAALAWPRPPAPRSAWAQRRRAAPGFSGSSRQLTSPE